MNDGLEFAYQTLRSQIFLELVDAARENNLMRVERMTQKLRELEAWWLGDTSLIDQQKPVNRGLPNNTKGKTQREAWVQTRIGQGILLKKLRGAIYQAPVGQIGIAFANEWPKRPNHFLLGLPDGPPLAAAALLCQRPTGISDLVLPSELMLDVWTKLSRSNGQVKINIRWLPHGTVSLLVPRHSWRDVTKYVGNYAGLVGGGVKQRSEELSLWR